ncbi:MAG: hypothetical protein Q8L54_02140 [Devosia sp.]|nr:hypothetical protein [Devosia sp.]
MTLSGPEALRSLDEALRDIRREEDEIAKRLARSAELATKIRETEGELFRQLAAVRLDPATQAEMAGQLSQAEARARNMLKQHANDLAATEEQLKDVDKAIAERGSERAELVSRAGRLEAELKALADEISVEAAKDPHYARKRQEAEELAHIAEESMRKTLQAEADREQKGRPYRDDPLFMYLWERSYGTKNYRANNLVIWLDGLVAGLVGYPEARPNFAMLNEIPLRLREHAERQAELAAAAQEEVTTLEKAAIDAGGGKPVREGLEQAEARIAEIDAEIIALEDQRDETAKSHRELAQGSDPAFAGAIAVLAEALGRGDIRTLLAEARVTRTAQDDTIVKQIDDARQRAQEEESETRDQKARLKTLAARRRELEDIQYEFKKSGFDNPRSSFREDRLVGDVLNEFLRGGISAANYWEQWRKSQNWTGGYDPGRQDGDEERRRESPWPGGFQWPDSSFGGGSGSRRSGGGFGGGWGRLPGTGGSGSGGFSRPRTGAAGARKHGGFKTGGGF